MIIINYLNFNCKLLEKYYNYFIIGKEISLINDIEKDIIKYYSNKHNLKIYRKDLNFKININEYKNKILLKEISPVFNVIIFTADEKLITSYKIKNILLLINNIIHKNYILIVKYHFINEFNIKTFIEDDIYKTINPLIINCKIENNFIEVKKWLLFQSKKNNINISNKLYNTLYELYKNDIDTLSHIIQLLFLNKNFNTINVKKILITQLKCFSVSELLNNLLNGKILTYFNMLYYLKNYNVDILIQFYNDIKNMFINLNYFFLSQYKNNFINNNINIDLLDKISKIINLKKYYLIINLLKDLDLLLIKNVYLDINEKYNIIFENLIYLSILIIT